MLENRAKKDLHRIKNGSPFPALILLCFCRVFGVLMQQRRWTETTIECYLRGCNCSNCKITPKLESKKCRAKKAVIELIKQNKKPPVKRRELILDNLTKAEKETLKYLALSNEEICRRQNKAYGTVKMTVHNIIEKFGANSRTEALVMALKEGLVNLNDVEVGE